MRGPTKGRYFRTILILARDSSVQPGAKKELVTHVFAEASICLELGLREKLVGCGLMRKCWLVQAILADKFTLVTGERQLDVQGHFKIFGFKKECCLKINRSDGALRGQRDLLPFANEQNGEENCVSFLCPY